MTSNIDATKPVTGGASTANVRQNFKDAKDEINSLLHITEDSVTAGGTADALEANFTIDDTITDGNVICVKAASANTSTTVTIDVDSTGPLNIVKEGNQSLNVGDIQSGHYLLLKYSGTNTNWELLNPSVIKAKSGRRNLLINGCFRKDERVGPYTTTGVYTLDGWVVDHNGTASTSQTTIPLGDIDGQPQYGIRVNKTAAGSDETNIYQRIEGVRVAEGPITISFTAKTTSAATWTIRALQNFGSGGSASGNVSTTDTVSATTGYVRHVVTLDLPTITGKTLNGGDDYLQIDILTGAARVEDIIVANWQVEKGSVVTDFEDRHIGEETSLCQRYYRKSTVNEYYGLFADDTTTQLQTIIFSPPMSGTPTVEPTKSSGNANVAVQSATSGGVRFSFTGNDQDVCSYSWTAASEL
jgi:hypothetical protein